MDGHETNLRIFDNEIERLERELSRCHEARREYVNRHNLNKRESNDRPSGTTDSGEGA